MKRFILLTISILYIFANLNLYSQTSYGGAPISFFDTKLTSEVDEIFLPAPNLAVISVEDSIYEANTNFRRIGRLIPVSLSMSTCGTWDYLADGKKVWRLKIKSPDAKSLTILYNNFYLPNGSHLFLYNESRNHVIGSFDHRTTNKFSTKFSTEMIEGDITYLEYIQESWVNELPTLDIEGVIYNYRDVDQFVGYYKKTKNPSFGSSGSCNVNVKCPEGNDFQSQKKGVACIYIVQGFFGGGYCTGTLVNNTANNGIPYFLTADHCGGVEAASTVAQWQFYFNFESSNCTNPTTAPTYNTITGCTIKARPSGTQSSGTDFLLLELNTTEDNLATIGAYYNGWNRGEDPSPSGVCIHHPSGDIKKISTYTQTATVSTYTGCTPNGHWEVKWARTATNRGITEGGSSGSPLFNNNKLVVGTLTGGSSDCNATEAQQRDLYGRFNLHWEAGGTANANRLKPWLDPSNTGATTCAGRNPNEGNSGQAPTANFEATPTTVNVGGTVNFTDLSTNTPTSWSWNFPGADNTSGNTANPSRVYNTIGTYDVSLTVTNANGTDTETKTAYINVVAEGTLTAAFSANPTTLPEGGSVDFTDESFGNPTSWNWEFQGGTPATSNQQNPVIRYNTAGIYNVKLTVSDGTNTNLATRNSYITVTQAQTNNLTAAFAASSYSITAGECINFNDLSTGGPTSWNWSFPGSQTTTSTAQNPSNICYRTPGIYEVVLEVRNSLTQNSRICSNCITVLPDPTTPQVNFEANTTVIPVGGVVRFRNTSQNGPFNQWAWSFEGGVPAVYEDSVPPPVAYLQAGLYNVELRGRKTNGVQDIELKTNYIRVVPAANVTPGANFAANRTVIRPGESINFIDLSSGNPYIWTWEFQGGTPAQSSMPNPTNILYSTAGVYQVRLTVRNNLGQDIMTKENYIHVSTTDPCTTAPTSNFTASPRLISQGESVYFQDLSENLPSYHQWSFPGGTPSSSTEGTPMAAIRYDLPGIYNVSLTVNNECGTSTITKEIYIYVFSGTVETYCDTLTTILRGETIESRVPPATWGFIAGQNGNNIKGYANYFSTYTFSEIKGIVVPVEKAVYGTYNSYIKFYIWDGNTPTPQNILGEKKIYIKDLIQNQANLVIFDQAVTINGPFFVGYTLNYPDENLDGMSDDLFVVGIAKRANNPSVNTMYLLKSGTWKTTNELYNYSASLPLKPISCLVNVETIEVNDNISIFPNPTSGELNINYDNNETVINKIQIFDALGRKVFEKEINNKTYNTSLTGFTEGAYIIQINTDKSIINKKLLLLPKK